MVADTSPRDFPLKAKWSSDFSEASGLAVYSESELSSLAFKAASALDLNATRIHGYTVSSPSAASDNQVMTWDADTSTYYWSTIVGGNGISVSKEGDAPVGPRPEINFSGVNINITVTDNSGEDRVDIVLSAGTGGVGGGGDVYAPSSAFYIVSGLDSGLSNERILNASGGTQLEYNGNNATISVSDLGITTGKIADGAITNPKIRDAAAVSVLGRSANSTGDVADIAAGADRTFLSRKSSTVGFNAIESADLPYTPAPASAIYVVSGADGLLSNERSLNASGGAVLQYTSTQATLSLSSTIDSTAKVEVQDGGGGTVGVRRILKFIAGNNIGITFNDTGDAVEITIDSLL